MTTRQEIEDAVAKYGTKPRHLLPIRYRDPNNEHDFSVAMAIITAEMPGVIPQYDNNDELIAFEGIKLESTS